MLKDFLNKKVKVTIFLSQLSRAFIPRDFKGVLTACEENYIKLDSNTIIATKFITYVELID